MNVGNKQEPTTKFGIWPFGIGMESYSRMDKFSFFFLFKNVVHFGLNAGSFISRMEILCATEKEKKIFEK